ncbi:putative MFS-type transporter YhjX [Orchesella cincta]|uniref:Putative MFS-type transporter YhjX n=1 Tax=Orchesella cincta TaxID=48709 RepID=A0A1D2NA31_ORCCI|nr:putative MFS-type transporter YhjX [Orchesella cincta]
MTSSRNEQELKTSASTTPFIIRLIQNHYTAAPPTKTPEQISRESWLLPGVISFNRWYCMPAAFIIQFCCGSLYSWSVFNKPIDTLIYGSIVNMAPITFYIAVGLLGLSAAIMGPWLEREGPKTASILGGFLFCSGNLITALALYLKQMWLIYLGYGVVAGYGIGICYISPVSALQKWFPDHRGLASGIAVSGFGAGAIVSAKLEVALIQHTGLPSTFLIMGLGYFVFIFVSGLVLRTPLPGFSPASSLNDLGSDSENPQVEMVKVAEDDDCAKKINKHDNSDEKKEWTLLEALVSTDFRLMYVMFFSNILFGLVAISRLSNMITDIFEKSAEHASTVVAINGGFNLSGRIFFSLLSDYIGRKNAYVVMLTCQLIILASFYFITTGGSTTYWLFLMCMWIIASCYGGGFGSIPAFLTDKFGQYNIGACHGVILTAWSFAGIVGGIVFTTVFKAASQDRPIEDPFPYNVNVWWMLGIVVVGWSALFFVKPTERDRRVYKMIRKCFGKK